MPFPEDETTIDLIKLLKSEASSPEALSAADELLELRVINETDDPNIDPALRGGIHPTRRP